MTLEELIAGGLHVLCLLGKDATLCAAGGKSGSVEVTELYRQLYEAAGDIKPVSGNTSKGSSLTTVNPPP